MSRAGVNVRQFRHSILLLAIVSFGLLPVAHTAGAGCVSYGDFLHPLGAYHPPGSYLRSIAYQEPHLYAMDDAGLLSVADASDPAFLHLLGSLDLAAESRGMAVAGSIAYAGLAPRSLQLVDLSDAGAPKPLGCAQIPSLIWNVEVAGSYAYVVAWEYGHDDHGVYVVDVSDPLAPVVGARVDVGSYPRDIAVAGGYGYVIEQYGLCVLDLANPAQPTVVSALDIPGDTRYLAVRDGFVYVVCAAEEYPATGDGLYIVDAGDPSHPHIEGRCVSRDIPRWGIALWDHYAIVGLGRQGMAFIDITRPESPQVVQSIGVQESPSEFAVTGSLLFAASGYVVSYALQESFTPAPAAVIPSTESSRVAAQSGDYAYLCRAGGEFLVVDMSDPENPQVTGSESLDFTWPQAMALTEGALGHPYAYVSGYPGAIAIVDIADPYHPQRVGTFAPPDDGRGLEVEGDYLYVVGGGLGLCIFDIANPLSPQWISNIDFTYSVHEVTAVGTTLYVGRRTLDREGLFILDVADPAHPRILGSSTAPECPYEIQVVGTLAYIADGDAGLLIMDVSDPQAPVMLGRSKTMRQARCVKVDGDLAYVLDEQDNAGLQVIDVSDPTVPFPIGLFQAERAYDLELMNGYALVATYTGLAVVAPLECESSALPENAGTLSAPAGLAFSANPGVGRVGMALTLAGAGNVELTLHDTLGRQVRGLYSGRLMSGIHRFEWDGRDRQGHPLAAGTYFARLRTEGSQRSARFLLIR